MPETDFAAWERRLGLSRADVTTILGISRQSANDLRRGRFTPHPSTRRLMQVLEDNPDVLRRLIDGDE